METVVKSSAAGRGEEGSDREERERKVGREGGGRREEGWRVAGEDDQECFFGECLAGSLF
jgi:hypothetical protein